MALAPRNSCKDIIYSSGAWCAFLCFVCNNAALLVVKGIDLTIPNVNNFMKHVLPFANKIHQGNTILVVNA